MLRRLFGLVSLAAVTAVAMAGPQNYSQRTQNIRAGIVILPSAQLTPTGSPQSAGPYALYNLDSNVSIKPAGWNFYNPFAPSRMSQAIFNRWTLIDPTTPAYNAGAPITLSKRNAAYWEVFLDQVSDTVLANYDLLVVNPVGLASLNPMEATRLRRFVDNGGVLWIDPAGLPQNGVDPFNNFPLPFQILLGTAAVPSNEQTNFQNSLMTCIQMLTPNDVDLLSSWITGATQTRYYLTAPTIQTSGIAGSTLVDFARLQPVSFVNGNETIATGRIGDGMVIVTADGASLKLNRSQESGPSYIANTGFYALDPVLESDGLAAAKLAVNMVGLLRESRQQAAGSRKTSSSLIDLQPPLLGTSKYAGQGLPGGAFASLGGPAANNSTPVIYKNLLVTSFGNTLEVFDSNPPEDLDGDGDPDDGFQDYDLGASYDLVWSSVGVNNMPGPLSAPVCSEIPGAGGLGVQDEVLVVDGNGKLHIFNLTPRKADGSLSGVAVEAGTSPINPPGASAYDAGLTGIPITPTVHEGIAYVVDTYENNGASVGRVWQVDLSTGNYVSSTSNFVIGSQTGVAPVQLPEFSYSATVGYIPIADNSGGVDKVMYIPFAPNTSLGNSTPAGVASIWIGAKGEVPFSFDPPAGTPGSTLTIATRANNHGGLPIYMGGGSLSPKVSLIGANGAPFTDAQMSAIFGNATAQDLNHDGTLTIAMAAGGLPSTVTGVRVDYTIDWGDTNSAALNAVVRGKILLPDLANGPFRSIRGGVALSPQGTIYVVNSYIPAVGVQQPGMPGGGLYGFREQGVGSFNCIDRYELYEGHTVELNQATNVTVPPLLADADGLQSVVPINLGTGFQALEFLGGPSIRNGQVFVTAYGTKTGAQFNGIPATVLMAFNAEPQTPQFIVGDLPTGSTILQPDIARSTNQLVPENQSVITNYTYDPNTQTISFPNLATIQTGQISQCLSLSQPVIVRKLGTPDALVYPDAIGGAVWNPVQWFFVVDGMSPSGGAPVVTGNSVFFSGSSNILSILNGSFPQAPSNGLLYAVNAQISASSLHPLSGKPWLNQLWTLNTANTPIGDPNILWPQINSVTSLNDFLVKVNQTTLGGNHNGHSTVSYGIAGGDNALVSWGDEGLYTFAKANIFICDEGRIIELDGSGNPIWSTDASVSQGQSAINAAGNYKPMIRPVRAYKQSETSVLTVDAGANRVAMLNTTGVESRSIMGFRLDPTIQPSGFTAGEPLSLSAPRDAAYYTTYVNMLNAAGILVTPADNATPYEYWQHYLIADSGNKRLVEVIDRFYYNPNTQQVGSPVLCGGVPQVGVLLWHSPASVSGKQYSYNSIVRLKVPDTTPTGYHYVYVAGIGGSMPTLVGTGLQAQSTTTTADAQGGSGGIVIFDPTNPAGVLTFNTIGLPDVTQTRFWDPNTLAFDTNAVNQANQAGIETTVRRQGGAHRLANLSAVSAKLIQVGNLPAVGIMICDATGVYEAYYQPVVGSPPAPGPPPSLPIDWMITNEAFCAIFQQGPAANPGITGQNAQGLKALFARRLDSGDVLIVNGYYGSTVGGGAFTGEVIQVDGTVNNWVGNPLNLGFGSTSVSLDLRNAGSGGIRGLVMPVFADRR